MFIRKTSMLVVFLAISFVFSPVSNAETFPQSHSTSPLTIHGVLVSDGGSPGTEIRVENTSSEPVRFILPRLDNILADVVVPPQESRYVRIELPTSDNNVRQNQQWKYFTYTGEEMNIAAEGNVVLAAGWGIQYNFLSPFKNCEKITWAYSDYLGGNKKRNKTSSMRADIREAFALLDSHTGLVFQETKNTNNADVVVQWISRGEEEKNGFDPSTIATAGYNMNGQGLISLNSTAERLGEKYAGTSPRVWKREKKHNATSTTFVAAGRVWTIVHEIMHLLGFQHVERELAVMNSHNYTIGVIGKTKINAHKLVSTGFSSGDKNGLRFMYPKNECITQE